jgi:hypothetical protein
MAPTLGRTDIKKLLEIDVERTRQSFDAATARFKAALAILPLGPAVPDSELDIQSVGREHRQTMVAYLEATTRFNDLLNKGIIPRDL